MKIVPKCSLENPNSQIALYARLLILITPRQLLRRIAYCTLIIALSILVDGASLSTTTRAGATVSSTNQVIAITNAGFGSGEITIGSGTQISWLNQTADAQQVIITRVDYRIYCDLRDNLGFAAFIMLDSGSFAPTLSANSASGNGYNGIGLDVAVSDTSTL